MGWSYGREGGPVKSAIFTVFVSLASCHKMQGSGGGGGESIWRSESRAGEQEDKRRVCDRLTTTTGAKTGINQPPRTANLGTEGEITSEGTRLQSSFQNIKIMFHWTLMDWSREEEGQTKEEKSVEILRLLPIQFGMNTLVLHTGKSL